MIWKSLCIATVLAGAVATGFGQEAVPAANARPGQDEIRRWIAQLGSNRFELRDQAMQALIVAGQDAVKPVLAAAFGNDREVALRSVIVLREIGARSDTESLQAALDALREIAAKPASSPVVARQATEAQVNLAAVRQERAIEHLRGLGALVSRDAEDLWYKQMTHVSIFSVEIGPEWRGTEKDLERLTWLTDVEQVSFVGPQVKDRWFAHLKSLPKLNSVKVKNASISNRALEDLAQIEGVWFMRLLYLPLDDTAVPILIQSKSLRRLVLISRDLSEAGREQLRQHFGKENVDCPPGGALLGITADVADGADWTVSQVIEGGAAAHAGILPKDRIVKYNGQPVADFRALKEFISSSVPGETATVEIERGLERLTKQVKFGEWE